MSAEEVTLDFSVKGYDNAAEMTTVEQDGVTVTFDKGTNSSNSPKYYNTGTAVRLYYGNTMTVSSTRNILSIAITFGTDDKTNEIITDCGTFADKTWTGSATAVKFSVGGTSGQRRIKALTIILGVAPAVAAPVISGTTPFLGSTTVTINCATEGASVYYTKDGAEPTAGSTPYTEPFIIEATTTVKAIAVKGEDISTVASKTFEAIPSVADIATLNALAKDAVFGFTGDAVVVANPNKKHVYIKDKTGSSLIFDAVGKTELAVGSHITPNWTGKVDIYNGLFEAVPTSTLTAVEGTPDVIKYDAATATDITEANVNKVVVLKGVTYTVPAEGKKEFTITAGDATVNGYNQFGIKIDAPVESDLYDIVGAISIYNTNIQFQPIAITRAPKVVPVTVEAATGADLTEFVNAEKTKITEGGDKVGDITINLAKDGKYTVSGSLEAPASIVIYGDATAPATIDASASADPFVTLSATPSVETFGDGYFRVNKVAIVSVKVNGIKNSIFYDNNTKYCVVDFRISNAVLNLATEAVKNDALVSFQAGGAKDVNITNSTIYGNNAVAKYFIRYHNAARLSRYGFDMETEFQKMNYRDNTFYGLLKSDGQWGNYNGIRGQKFVKFQVWKNIWYNCGKDIMRRMAGSIIRDDQILSNGIGGNTYFNEGVDESASEARWDMSGIILVTDPKFADAANGDFTIGAGTQQAYLETGDPRWRVEYVAEDLTDAKAALKAEIEKATALLGDADPATDEAAKALKDAIDKAQGVYETAEFNEILKAATEELKAAEEAYKAATSGITNIDADTDADNGAWYNLQGVRVEKPAQRGIYIHNGKKVVIK